MRRLLLIVLVVFACAAESQARQGRPQDVRLQEAIRLETVEHNLPAAIDAFRAIAREYEKTDRRVAALALLHLADCYRKQGEGQAQAIYREVAQKFSDQPDVVARARAYLATGSEDASQQRWVWTPPKDADVVSRVSADGRWLAYVDWSDTGAGDLFLQDLSAGASRRVTRTGNSGSQWAVAVGSAAVSRDGTQVAYAWFAEDRTELRITATRAPGPGRAAPEPRIVTMEDVGGFEVMDWSPDGGWIAGTWQPAGQPRQIGLIKTTDGSRRVLRAIDQPCVCRVSLVFSPDSQMLAYGIAGADTRTRDIHVIEISTARSTPVVTYDGDDELIGWSPDGSRIAFTSRRTGALGVWAVPFKDGSAGFPSLVKGEIGAFHPLGITATGSIVSCRCEPQVGSDIKITTFDWDTGRFLSPLTDAVQQHVGNNSQPFWSNDGRSFLYRSLRPGQDPMLVIRSAETQDARELRPKLATIIDPRWSPDDKSIMVIARDFQDQFGLYRVDAQTGQARPVIIFTKPGVRTILNPMGPQSSWSRDGRTYFYSRTHPELPIDTAWVSLDLATAVERVHVSLPGVGSIAVMLSPDERTLYYRPSGPWVESTIIVRDLASGQERELFRHANLGPMNLSPDGRTLAVSVGATGGEPARMVLVPVDGGQPRELVRAPDAKTAGQGLWAPDGTSMLVRWTVAEGIAEFWWVPLDGRAPVKLKEFDGLVPAGLRLHPDGKRLLFGATPAVVPPPALAEIWVWDGLFPRGAR